MYFVLPLYILVCACFPFLVSVQRFSQQLSNSSNVTFGGDNKIKEFPRGRIVEIPSSSETPFSVMSGGSMTISNQISQGGVTMGVASSSYVTSPSKTYSRTPMRSSGTIVSITPGGEITPIGTVSTAPRVTKPYPYPRSNAAAATMMGGSPVVSQPVVPPMSIIPPDQLLENQCDLCSKVYKNRSTLYSHKNRDHGIRGGAAMNNPKN